MPKRMDTHELIAAYEKLVEVLDTVLEVGNFDVSYELDYAYTKLRDYLTENAKDVDEDLAYYDHHLPDDLITDALFMQDSWPATRRLLLKPLYQLKKLETGSNSNPDTRLSQLIEDIKKPLKDYVVQSQSGSQLPPLNPDLIKLTKTSYNPKTCVLDLGQGYKVEISKYRADKTSTGKDHDQALVMKKVLAHKTPHLGVTYKEILGIGANKPISSAEINSVSNAVTAIKTKLKRVSAPPELIFVDKQRVYIKASYLLNA